MDLMDIMYSCPWCACLCVGAVSDCGSEIIACYEFIPRPVGAEVTLLCIGDYH